MATTKKIKFRLNHNCGKPGCVGMPGQVIEVTPADRDYLLQRNGGEVVIEAAEPEVKTPTPTATQSPEQKSAPNAKKK